MFRSVIYIDGPTLRSKMEPFSLQERDIDWGRVFERLTPEGHVLLRAYWYQVAQISPWKFNPRFCSDYCPEHMTMAEYQQIAEAYYGVEVERLETLHNAVFGRIEEQYDGVEFRYAGVMKVDPTWVWTDKTGKQRFGRRLGEKGVDVALAVDMVRQCADYDHVMILGGDYDYVPALQAVKDRLKRVTTVSILRGSRNEYQGGPRKLRGLGDNEVILYEDDLKTEFAVGG